MVFTPVYIFAMLIGVLVTVVPILNGSNSLALSSVRVSFFHYFTATLTGVVFLILTSSFGMFTKLADAPIHYFLGGFLGLFVISLMNYYSTRISALHISILPFLGQMTMGLMLDYFLLDKFSLKVVIGLSIVLIGLYIQTDSSKEPVPSINEAL